MLQKPFRVTIKNYKIMFNSDMIDVMLLKNIYKIEHVVAILILKNKKPTRNKYFKCDRILSNNIS